jgi:hypothetical protein
MCEHLKSVEDYIVSIGVKETFRGQAWSNNCREWVYFSCILKPKELINKFRLSSFIKIHDHFDLKSGSEFGLVCELCKDGIMGLHPKNPESNSEVVVG